MYPNFEMQKHTDGVSLKLFLGYRMSAAFMCIEYH